MVGREKKWQSCSHFRMYANFSTFLWKDFYLIFFKCLDEDKTVCHVLWSEHTTFHDGSRAKKINHMEKVFAAKTSVNVFLIWTVCQNEK